MSLLHVGLDIGSTTAKLVVLDDVDRVIHSRYSRHFADIHAAAGALMEEVQLNFGDSDITMTVAGSGGISIAECMDVPFTQELIACSASVERYLKGVDVAIELGGEDAKLTFFDQAGVDQRMNETCAGGTGAFLDQMAALLGTDANGLNEMAKGYTTLYPIASRCGVFAKTDVQPLLNDGASRSDIAASILQAIVTQTISGLACGRKITGRVAFLGGPLYFMSELRKRFVETLCLAPDDCIFPENPHLFVAIGAAILGKKKTPIDMDRIRQRAVEFLSSRSSRPVNVLPSLFANEQEREAFKVRHSVHRVAKEELGDYKGDAYLGVDVGSTTTKVVLIGGLGELLFSRYCMNSGGEPVKTVAGVLAEIYERIPEGVSVRASGVTGYGEKLVQAALGIDVGEVETVAHAKAAEFVQPGVEFVIDIGGQDMKCLGIKDGVINRVFLNEACSSGCGSFLQSFSESLGMDVKEFARAAEESEMPVDLGSRCTVFMNSRVRQAQKEGASISDISAGLVYSVVKNALYKVLKIRSAEELGERIVVQGGAFKNDALLRAFEMLTGREVVRPQISELMGAFGAALLAREAGVGESTLISRERLQTLEASTRTSRCAGCGNRCILTVTAFADGRRYISGNRCEKGGSSASAAASAADGNCGTVPPNVFELKYARLFDHYQPLPLGLASRGVLGIPRVLNMYEDYPFWFTLLTGLGFRVQLSSAAPDESLGIDTIPSQTLCYPAKVAHRHIVDLIEKDVPMIFYPIIQRESPEFADAHQNFNCPVVTGYPDVLRLNIDEISSSGLRFFTPSFALEMREGSKGSGRFLARLIDEFAEFGVSRSEMGAAYEAAVREHARFKEDVQSYGDKALRYVKETSGIGIVLAGHPYHLDPEVHHGIPQLIRAHGVTVLTEDSICHRADEVGGVEGLEVVDQWVYHSRLYRAATVLARHPEFENVHMVQLNSFGCGLDAISADQSAALLERYGKLHTLIKIDEGKNNGAVKIRIRSLLASVRSKPVTARGMERKRGWIAAEKPTISGQTRTILCPPLSSHHFQLLEAAMRSVGMDFQVLPEGSRQEIELGLKYVNNDACYPAMVVVGQFIAALQSGKYDLEKTDCLYAQTGGACRASNYVPLLRKALDAAGFEGVRVLAANAQGNAGAEPFAIPAKAVWRSLLGMIYGDMLMKLQLGTRPYEIQKGSTNRLYERWSERCRKNVANGSWRRFRSDLGEMARDFDSLPVDLSPKPRVGIVGEILVKYHANSNENLVRTIEEEGGEAVVPDLSNFMLYCLFDPIYAHKILGGNLLGRIAGEAGIRFLEYLKKPMRDALKGTRFDAGHSIRSMADDIDGVVSPANQGGEGWLLTSEMINLIEGGIKNVLCIQPFACLPNHITGKGAIKELKRRYRGANILALDYDASVSNVNQLNRIKLLMATARP